MNWTGILNKLEIFILIWKVFWSAFQWCILKYCQFSSFLVRGQNVKKTVKKSQKSNISGLAKESYTELQAENMLHVIFQGPSFQWKKIWVHLKPTSWDIQFLVFISVSNFFIFSMEKDIKNAFLPDFDLNFHISI
jgi:hypothetical protein